MSEDHQLLIDLGKRLRQARAVKGLSQEELAHRAGLHRTYASSVERGERNVSVLNLVSLATALEIEPGELIAGMTRRKRQEIG